MDKQAIKQKRLKALAAARGTDKTLTLLAEINELYDTLEASIFDVETKINTKFDELLQVIPDVKDGYTPQKDIDYFDGKPGKDYVLTDQDRLDIAKRIPVPIVEKIIERTEVIKEPIITNQIIKETKEIALTDTPEETVKKVNSSKTLIEPSQIKGLEDIRQMAIANSVPVTTSFFNGLRAKNLIIAGATASQQGDTVTLTVPSSSSSSGFQQPTSGTVDGSNQTFTWATAPNVIVVDGGRSIQKVSSDGTVNWTAVGTTTTLTISPNFDLFALS